MNTFARRAGELRDLVERFRELSEDALRSCEAGDDAGLAGALDAREVVGTRLGEVSAQVADARRRLSQGEVAATVNARLIDRAMTTRMAIAREMERLQRDTEASSAYQGREGQRSGSLDTVR
jgi:hypothetical protein